MHNKVKITAAPLRVIYLLLYGNFPWLERVGDRILIYPGNAAYLHTGLRQGRFMDALRRLQAWGAVGTIAVPQPGMLSIQVLPPSHFVLKAPNREADASSGPNSYTEGKA